MMRSMFAAISGLRAHQLMMDVVSDNIANVNTPGFKGSRVIFEDTLAQLLAGGTAPGLRDANGLSQPQGGTDPEQVGLGVRVAGTEMNDTAGSLQSTGRPTDIAISGSGYLAVRSGTDLLYTRAGSLSFDQHGNLVDPTGMIVQGWLPDASGNINPTGPTTDITLPLGALNAPAATTTVYLGGNLSADAKVGDTTKTPITVYNASGQASTLNLTLTNTGPGAWSVSDGTNSFNLTFNSNGTLATPPGGTGQLGPYTVNLVGSAGSSGGITGYGGATTAIANEQDGAPAAGLSSFAIGADGTVTGSFSDNRTKVLGKIAIATFSNPNGLERVGESHLRPTGSSGPALMQAAGAPGAGTFASGVLEMSNVDLGQEFTNLIIAQRGFQANSRVISADDQLLQDLVNLTR